MNVPKDATGTDVFPHDEYHFYVIDQEDNPLHIHLPEDIVQDARDLIDADFPTKNWVPTFKHHLGDGIYFHFNPRDPDYSTFRQHPPFGDDTHRLMGASYNDPVHFDSHFIHKSTGPPADKKQHHYKDFRESVVLPEHREQYMEELIAWEENGGWDTDWIEPLSSE